MLGHIQTDELKEEIIHYLSTTDRPWLSFLAPNEHIFLHAPDHCREAREWPWTSLLHTRDDLRSKH